MGRYSDIGMLKTDKGKRYYKTVFYPEIPMNVNDIYILTTHFKNPITRLFKERNKFKD